MVIEFTFKKKNTKKTNISDSPFKAYLHTLNYINDNNIDAICDLYRDNNECILNSTARNILVMGDVQSGKTNNLIYLIDQKVKRGVRFFFYLTGHLNIINEQNIWRLKNAFRIINENVHIISAKSKYIDEDSVDRISKKNNKEVFLFYGIKDLEYFKKMINSISNSITGANEEIVIIDDEADYYTLSRNFRNYRYTLKKSYTKILYISITATPYMNLYSFQNLYDVLYFYKNPKGYVGLSDFIYNKRLVEVPNTISKEKILANLLFNAFISDEKNIEIIWNTSRLKVNHNEEANEIKHILQKSFHISRKLETIKKTQKDFDNFCQTFSRNILISNSDYSIINNRKPWKFIIGRGNLSRAITYKYLISSFFKMKNSKKFDAGVIMQASRWFGYRDINKVKAFVNEDLFNAYIECLDLDKTIRKFNMKDNFMEIFRNKNYEKIMIKEEKAWK